MLNENYLSVMCWSGSFVSGIGAIKLYFPANTWTDVTRSYTSGCATGAGAELTLSLDGAHAGRARIVYILRREAVKKKGRRDEMLRTKRDARNEDDDYDDDDDIRPKPRMFKSLQ